VSLEMTLESSDVSDIANISWKRVSNLRSSLAATENALSPNLVKVGGTIHVSETMQKCF